MYPTSHQEFSQEEIELDIRPETTKPQDAGCPHDMEDTRMPLPEACSEKCNRCGHTPHAKGFQCQARRFQCKICHKFGHFTSVCFQKSQGQHSSNSFHARKPKAQQLCVGALYTLQDAGSSEYDSDPEENFCLQMKVRRTRISHPDVHKPVYLMANLAYCLKEHHTRNQYLWARLDTCADVNLMPMAVYCLMFKDPQLKSLPHPIWRLRPTHQR